MEPAVVKQLRFLTWAYSLVWSALAIYLLYLTYRLFQKRGGS